MIFRKIKDYALYVLEFIFLIIVYLCFATIDFDVELTISSITGSMVVEAVLLSAVTTYITKMINDNVVLYNKERHNNYYPRLNQVLETNEMCIDYISANNLTEELRVQLERYNKDKYIEKCNVFIASKGYRFAYKDIDFEKAKLNFEEYVQELAHTLVLDQNNNREMRRFRKTLSKVINGKIRYIPTQPEEVMTKGKADDRRTEGLHNNYGLIQTLSIIGKVISSFAIYIVIHLLTFKPELILNNDVLLTYSAYLIMAVVSGITSGISSTLYLTSVYSKRNSFFKSYMGIKEEFKNTLIATKNS